MIEIYDNFLDEKVFKQVQQEVLGLSYEPIQHGDDVAYKLDSGTIYKTKHKQWSDNPTALQVFFDAMAQQDFLPSDVFSIMVHVYEPGAEISWHRDYASLASYSFYIHDEWRSEWGGQLMVTDSTDRHRNNGNVFDHRQDVMIPGVGQYYEPIPNRLVIIKDCLHKVNRCNHRRTSLTGFFK